MNENNQIFEGFWDTLITKAKQGAYAVAGAAGSGTAKGRLSVSLLSDAMYSQFKEYLASTGSEVNASEVAEFLGRMGFSKEFVAVEANQFKAFLNASDPVNNPARTGDGAAHAEPEAEPQKAPRPEQGQAARRGKAGGKPFPGARPNQTGDAAKPAANAADDTATAPQAKVRKVVGGEIDPDQRAAGQDEQDKINAKAAQDHEQAKERAKQQASDKQRMTDQKAVKDRMQQKKADGPRARNKTRESIEEGVLDEALSDSQLRKFFDTLAQRAMKSGEAKSAATKTIANTRTSQVDNTPANNAPARVEPTMGQPAAQQTQAPAQASPAQQPAQAQAQPQAQAQTAPVTNTAASAETPASAQPVAPSIDYSPQEKALLDRYGNNLPNQIGSADKDVTALARKIMRGAVADYVKQFGGSAQQPAQPEAQPTAQPSKARPQKPARKPLPGAKPAQPAKPQAAPTQQAATPNQTAANQANPQAPAA